MLYKNVLTTAIHSACLRNYVAGMVAYSKKMTLQNVVGRINAPPKRYKNTMYTGVKGIRSKKYIAEAQTRETSETIDGGDIPESLHLDDRGYDEVAINTMHVRREIGSQNVLVIQPYIKWSPKGTTAQVGSSANDQLKEAEALIRSLPNWNIAFSLKVPLESLERKTLFGVGKTEEIKALVQDLRTRSTSNNQQLTCLFISKGTLSFAQKCILEAEFNLPVMDRYSVVIQILRLHAISAEARLQVAMAEIPYIWAQAKGANLSNATKQGYSLTDAHREILRTRERKIRNELQRIRSQRKLLRKKRMQKEFPTVAVVGYTNAGKTSLIKALTGEHTIQPRDQLFATLDVTAHAGFLHCGLEVIYMDTVGFLSDLPTGLMECFIATLEDAMLADIILHVHDVSHACFEKQKKDVEFTLKSLTRKIFDDDSFKIPPIISVGNKVDLVTKTNNFNLTGLQLVSSTQQTGLEELLVEIERQILAVTGRRQITIRVRSGGPEMAWLYKNAAVTDTMADPENVELLLMGVVISDSVLQHFKRQFCQ